MLLNDTTVMWTKPAFKIFWEGPLIFSSQNDFHNFLGSFCQNTGKILKYYQGLFVKILEKF